MTTTFKPSFEPVGQLTALPLGNLLSKETMFYQSTPEFARLNGGPITREFLDMIPLYDNTIVDVRVHHLQVGYYPAIPGYHLDWIPRKNKGQDPDLSVIPEYQHYMMILAETSLTEFVAQDITVDLPDERPFQYVNEWIKTNDVRTENTENGTIMLFDSHQWHRPVPAQGTEWRYLIRASRVDHVRPSNEVRQQAQVYIPIQEASW